MVLPKIPFAFILICSLFSCGPIDKVQCEREYAFEIDFELEESKDTFSIGDTIFLSMDFSKMLTDKINGEKFDATSIPINTKFSTSRIDTDPASCTGGLFDLVTEVGGLDIVQLTGNCLSRFVRFQENQERLTFSLGVIPKEKGLFVSGFVSNFDFGFPELKENCKTDTLQVTYRLLPNKGDSNFELLSYSPDERIRTTSKEVFMKEGAFAYVVVD